MGDHYYLPDGTKAYDIGKREARKQGALPSVTTVQGIRDKYHINQWMIRENLKTAYDWAGIEEQGVQYYVNIPTPQDVWVKDMMTLTSERLAKAPDHGTAYHDALEKSVKAGQVVIGDYDFKIHPESIQAVLDWLDEERIDPVSLEESFGNAELGYGGTADLLGTCYCWPNGVGRAVHDFAIDYKTKETEPGVRPKFYPENCEQLIAYIKGLHMHATGISVIVSRNEPGVIHTRKWKPKELAYHWRKFQLTLALWHHEHKWVPYYKEG